MTAPNSKQIREWDKKFKDDFLSTLTAFLLPIGITFTILGVGSNLYKGILDIIGGQTWAGRIGLGAFYLAGIATSSYGSAEQLITEERKRETHRNRPYYERPESRGVECWQGDDDQDWLTWILSPSSFLGFILGTLFPFLFAPMTSLDYCRRYFKLRAKIKGHPIDDDLVEELIKLQERGRVLKYSATIEAILKSAPQTILQMYMLHQSRQTPGEDILGFGAIVMSLATMSLTIFGRWSTVLEPYHCNIELSAKLIRYAVIYLEALSLVCIRTTVVTIFIVTAERSVFNEDTLTSTCTAIAVLVAPRLLLFLSHYFYTIWRTGQGKAQFSWVYKLEYFMLKFSTTVFESLICYPVMGSKWVAVYMDCECVVIVVTCFFMRSGETPNWQIFAIAGLLVGSFLLNQIFRFYRSNLFAENSEPLSPQLQSPLRLLRVCQNLVKLGESFEVNSVDLEVFGGDSIDDQETDRCSTTTERYDETSLQLDKIVQFMKASKIEISNYLEEVNWPVYQKLMVLCQLNDNYRYFPHLARLPARYKIAQGGKSVTFTTTATYIEMLARCMERTLILVLNIAADEGLDEANRSAQALINLYYKVFMYCRSIYYKPPLFLTKCSPDLRFNTALNIKQISEQQENVLAVVWSKLGEGKDLEELTDKISTKNYWKRPPLTLKEINLVKHKYINCKLIWEQ